MLDDFTVAVTVISFGIVQWLIEGIQLFFRHRSGYDCEHCRDWLCPHHGCQRKKNKRP